MKERMIPDDLDGPIARALENLSSEFGEFKITERTWTVSSEAYKTAMSRYESGIVGGAGVWVYKDNGSVLLVRRVGDDGWADPGGKQEVSEDLTETARREVKEETGIICSVDGILQARVIRRECDNQPGEAISSLIVIFYGRRLSGTIRPQEGEIAAAKWWSEHPPKLLYNDLADFPIPFNPSDG